MGRKTGKFRFTLLFINPEDVKGGLGTSHAHWFLFKRKKFHRRGNLYLTTHLYIPDTEKRKQVTKAGFARFASTASTPPPASRGGPRKGTSNCRT